MNLFCPVKLPWYMKNKFWAVDYLIMLWLQDCFHGLRSAWEKCVVIFSPGSDAVMQCQYHASAVIFVTYYKIKSLSYWTFLPCQLIVCTGHHLIIYEVQKNDEHAALLVCGGSLGMVCIQVSC